jgi:RHS repeat-associated protein
VEEENFIRETEYDALDRVTRVHDWHRAGERAAVFEPRYNRRGLLEAQDVELRGRRTAAVSDVVYNARGQREHVRYGNGTITRYRYDARTFRLEQLRTTRPGYDPEFPSARGRFRDERVVQNLFCTYDPVGNLTEVHDDAFAPAFFRNRRVEAASRYRYDALYRLVEATGRESVDGTAAPGPFDAEPHGARFPIADGALRDYVQLYEYDAAGNVLRMSHTAPGGGWTRNCRYAEDSNRLARSWTGTDETGGVDHGHDLHGNMLNLDRTPEEYRPRWDYRDMIRELDLGGGGLAHYSYGAERQRTRKVVSDRDGTRRWERLYLGGMEIYRRHGASGIVEEIETHHVSLDGQRVLLIEDVLTDAVEPLFRYQYSDPLQSVALELNGGGEVISYEEYHPYGTSAYRATGRDVRAAMKRYRYTGMERDEESGLSYHTARYYAPWLARWTSADPAGLGGGMNLYRYADANPRSMKDESGRCPQSPYSGVERLMREGEPGELTYGGIAAGRLAAELNFIAENPPPPPGWRGSAEQGPDIFTFGDQVEAFAQFTRLVNRGLIVFDPERGRYRGNLRGFRQFQTLMEFEDFRHAFGVALSERWRELELNRDIQTFIVGPAMAAVEVGLMLLTAGVANRAIHWLGRLLMAPATRRLLAADAILAAEYAEAALARATATAANLRQVAGVTRTVAVATGEEMFVHTTASAAGPEAAALNIQETTAIRLSTSPTSAHWGPGVYAYEGRLPAQSGFTQVQFRVPPGTAIERIAIPGQRTIVRLVPASGDVLGVTEVVTNLSPAEVAEAVRWLRIMRGGR